MSIRNDILLAKFYRMWACVGDCGEGVMEWDFTLNWMLSGYGGNSMTENSNKSYLEGGKTRLRHKYNW